MMSPTEETAPGSTSPRRSSIPGIVSVVLGVIALGIAIFVFSLVRNPVKPGELPADGPGIVVDLFAGCLGGLVRVVLLAAGGIITAVLGVIGLVFGLVGLTRPPRGAAAVGTILNLLAIVLIWVGLYLLGPS